MTSFSLLLKLLLETGSVYHQVFYLPNIQLTNVPLTCWHFIFSLFHVVVETDVISTKIIKYLTSEKGGRITFIPLNRVKVAHVKYPHSSDVVPLLKKLNFSQEHSPAFSQVDLHSGLLLIFISKKYQDLRIPGYFLLDDMD